MPRTRTQHGFSLVEVLVVLVILAIGLLGLMALQVMNLRSGSTSRGRETATFIAKGLLDEVQAEAQIDHLKARYAIAQPKDFKAVYNDDKTTEGTVYFDHQGQRLASDKGSIFKATWKRLAAKGTTPNTAEYLAEVVWTFETGPGGVPLPRTVSMDRLITR